MEPKTETVLVLGATGNIGVSAVKGALNSGRSVLAVIRNQDSAKKLVKHVGSSEGITFVEADVTSDTGTGVKGVVEKVRNGELPGFQHVYSCVGGEYVTTPLKEITTDRLRYNMNVMFEAALFAYQATTPYLLSLKTPTTWTLCTGAQGDVGTHPLPGMTQGALFTFALAACRENLETNIRFNEVYLAFRVEVDEDAERSGAVRASEFAGVYEQILDRSEIRGCRVEVREEGDMVDLKFGRRF